MSYSQLANYYHHKVRPTEEFDQSSFATIPIERAHLYGEYEGKKFLKSGNLARVAYHYPSKQYQVQSILELKRK